MTMDGQHSVDTNSLWVFGYGSLCWYPGFKFRRSSVGYIRGFSRRFWQGNTTHRGTPDKPGRVATLVEDQEAVTWGKAYEIGGEDALKYLEHREGTLGGYKTLIVDFNSKEHNNAIQSFPVLLYMATPDNRHWLGPASLQELATQISQCQGPSGDNADYVVRLAQFMRESVPEVADDHLFTLEALVRSRIKDMESSGDLKSRRGLQEQVDAGAPGGHHQQMQPQEPRRDSFEFTSRVPSKKLRCLNV